jgi:hypothetical protein
LYITIVIELDFGQEVIKLDASVDLKLFVLSGSANKVHIKNLEEVRLVLCDFNLLDERFKKDFDWNGGKLAENLLQVSENKFAHGLLFMIFDKQKGKFLVQNGGVWIFFGCKLIQEIEHDLK